MHALCSSSRTRAHRDIDKSEKCVVVNINLKMDIDFAVPPEVVLPSAAEAATAATAVPNTTDTSWRRFLIEEAAKDVPNADMATAIHSHSHEPSTTTTKTTKKDTHAFLAKAKHAVTSKVGVALLCILATFLVSLILLVVIQPRFVQSDPESKLETPKLSANKAAAGAGIAAAIAAVVIGIIAIVKSKSK